MKNRVYVLVLPFLLLALTYGCGGNKENTEKNLVPFTEDSLKIVGIFQRALTSATPDIQIDSALALVRQSSNSYQSADLFLLQKAT